MIYTLGDVVKICYISERVNPVMTQVAEILKAEGVSVDVINPEQTLFNLTDLRVEYDLYIFKSKTDYGLTLAGMLHMMGAKIINPYPTVVMLRNKLIVMQALRAAGIPTPETYMASSINDLAPLLKNGPLITKPYRGCSGLGINIIHNMEEIKHLTNDQQEPILAQRYYEPDDGEGQYHKIFSIGPQIFGRKRIWPLQKYEDKMGIPFTPSQELQEMTYKIGDIFGITLRSVDFVISEGKPYVVDVNKFGSFVGVPNAPQLLVDHIKTLV